MHVIAANITGEYLNTFIVASIIDTFKVKVNNVHEGDLFPSIKFLNVDIWLSWRINKPAATPCCYLLDCVCRIVSYLCL